jgi:hypothetical protein
MLGVIRYHTMPHCAHRLNENKGELRNGKKLRSIAAAPKEEYKYEREHHDDARNYQPGSNR